MDTNQPELIDVLVVGAGISGLCAAYELMMEGVSVQIFEARDRVGGRILTVREPWIEGQYAEGGAEYIGTDEERVLSYMKDFGLKKARRFQRHQRVAFGGEMFSFEEVDQIDESLRGKLEEHFYGADLEACYEQPLREHFRDKHEGASRWTVDGLISEDLAGMSIAEALDVLGASDADRRYLRMRLCPTEGVDLDQISTSALAEGPWPSNYNRQFCKIDGGNDLLPKAFADALGQRVQLNHFVKQVKQCDGFLEVHAEHDGQPVVQRALNVLFATPAQLLSKIEMTPPLSEEKQEALALLKPASAMKIQLQYEKRFWQEDGWNANALTDKPINLNHATELQDGQAGILNAYMTADVARAYQELDEEERISQLLLDVGPLFPEGMNEHREALSIDWDADPFAEGAWAYYPIEGEREVHEALCASQDNYFFTGEYLTRDEDHLGTMEGAISSAQAVADELIVHLHKTGHSK